MGEQVPPPTATTVAGALLLSPSFARWLVNGNVLETQNVLNGALIKLYDTQNP